MHLEPWPTAVWSQNPSEDGNTHIARQVSSDRKTISPDRWDSSWDWSQNPSEDGGLPEPTGWSQYEPTPKHTPAEAAARRSVRAAKTSSRMSA